MEMYQSDYNARVESNEWRRKNISFVESSNSNKFNIASSDPFRNSEFNKNIKFTSSVGGVAPSIARYTPHGFLAYAGVDAFSNYALKLYDDKFKELQLGKYAPSSKNSGLDPSTSAIIPDPSDPNILPVPVPEQNASSLIDVLSSSSISSSNIANQLALSNMLSIESSSDIVKSIKSIASLIATNSEIEVSYREVRSYVAK